MNVLALLWLAEIGGDAPRPVYAIWMGLYLLAYVLLGIWTAFAYRSWREWRYALVLQGALILLTMVADTFLEIYLWARPMIYLLFRPMTVLLGSHELTGRLFSGDSVVYLFLDYFIAFAEIAVIQSIAIGCRWLVTWRKGKIVPESEE